MSSKRSNNAKSRLVSLNQKQMKNLWKTNVADYTSDAPVKKMRIFNKPNYSTKGRIVVDSGTWIEYDYSKDVGTKVHHKNETNIPRDVFHLPKYPVLRAIRSELPDSNDEDLKDMDLFLIKDIKEGVLWKNNEFEFHS